MSRRFRAALFTALLAAMPSVASAQAIAVGAKVGTAGLGADVGLSLGSRTVPRGGLGYFPIDFDLEADGIDYGLSFPGVNGTLGLDFQVAGPLRLMGGLFYKSDGIEGSAAVQAGDEIGDLVLTEAGTVTAALDLDSAAPYVGIGFGKLAGGFGVYLDLAVAWMGQPDVALTASDNLNEIPGFAAELEQERQSFVADLPDNVPYPIVQFGVKFGLGR